MIINLVFYINIAYLLFVLISLFSKGSFRSSAEVIKLTGLLSMRFCIYIIFELLKNNKPILTMTFV